MNSPLQCVSALHRAAHKICGANCGKGVGRWLLGRTGGRPGGLVEIRTVMLFSSGTVTCQCPLKCPRSYPRELWITLWASSGALARRQYRQGLARAGRKSAIPIRRAGLQAAQLLGLRKTGKACAGVRAMPGLVPDNCGSSCYRAVDKLGMDGPDAGLARALPNGAARVRQPAPGLGERGRFLALWTPSCPTGRATPEGRAAAIDSRRFP